MSRKVLIVEDHPEQADFLRRILYMRLDVDTALERDGLDGLKWTREHVPDLVLLDLMLPDINGFDFCKRVREDARTFLTPIVIVSALNDDQHRLHGYRVGANSYVTKPYGVEDLFDAIEAAWAWRTRMEREPREGEIQIQAHHKGRTNEEITLEICFNDLLTRLRCCALYTADQLGQLRTFVAEMARLAIEWGLRENVNHPLKIMYQIDHQAFTLTACGHPEGPSIAPTSLSELSEPDGAKNAQSKLQGTEARKRPGTTVLPCPNCRRPLRVPTGRGELILTCPVCRTRWDWSPPKEADPRISTFGHIYQGLTERGLVDEVRYSETGSMAYLTKSFTS
jgi:DNA-binding response OmpR family regulator